jgi:hypothetical protein
MTDAGRAYTPGTGLPIALPAGSSEPGTSVQVSDTQPDIRGTNTPLSSSSYLPGHRGHRVSAAALRRLDDVLPDRDRHVLERVAEHRYLSTHQIQRFVFTEHVSEASAARTARRVLQRLHRMGLLRPLRRRIGGVRAGSAARVWQLAPAAARLLHDDGAAFRTNEPSRRFLAHCLAVADVHLATLELQDDPDPRQVTVQTEPAAWRRYVGSGGEARWLQPDLAAVVSSADYEDRWFIEVDLGTESLPTLLRKCGQYETYRHSAIEQEAHGVFPLVLWFFTQPERAERLQASVERSHRLTPALYRYATPDTLRDVLRGGGA